MKRGRSVAVAGAAIGLLLTGCGSSKVSSSTPTNGAGGSSATVAGSSAPTKGPVSIMVIAPENTQEGNHPEVPAAVRAAVLAFNSSGGVDGHTVKVIYCNSDFQAQTAAQCARQAVSDGVVAVVSNREVFGDSMNPILQAAGIPSIGNIPVEASDFSSPISYPIDAGEINNFQGDVLAMAQLGLSKQAVMVLDIPAGATIIAALAPAFKAAKTPRGVQVEMVGTVKIPVTASDYTPFAQALHNEGAQGVIGVASPQQIEGVMKAASSLGYKFTFSTTAGNLSLADAKIVGSEGAMVGTGDEPSPTGTTAAAKQFRADMAAAQKAGVPDANELSYGAIAAWMAAQAFKDVASEVAGPLTAHSLKAALDKAKNVAVVGLPSPWTPVDNSRPAAVARIAENSVYPLKLDSDGTWSALTATPINVAAALAGSAG